MNKKILYLLLSITMVVFIGCTTKVNTPANSNSNTPSTTSTQTTNTSTTESSPFTLTDNSSYFCPFVFKDKVLFFANPAENNRISKIPEPLPADILQSKNVTDFADYYADNIAIVGENIYFSDGSNNNALCSIDPSKAYTKHTTHSIHNLIAVNTDLFYLNKNDANKIYKYDTTTSNSILVCADSVGSFIVSGDFIIYQNLSDNSKLYSIKTDGTNKQKLTDYTANSFVVFDGQLLFFNSSDNNNLYTIDPSTLTCKRLNIMNGFQLKVINKSLYFINGDDSNNLYSLSVDIAKSTATYKSELSEGINEYYLTDAGIFYNPSINVNNIYYKKLSTKS